MHSLNGQSEQGEIVSLIHKIHEAVNRCTCIGLIDVDNKIKEAEYNALQFFQKKCPYCDKGVFEGHTRNKLNIDHFWPIAKGGQHVPWNILPVCGRCNRKKKDKLPFEFLEYDRYIACIRYLESVRTKYGDESQKCVEMIAKIKSSILNDKTLRAQDVVKRLCNIFEIQMPQVSPPHNISYDHTILDFINERCLVANHDEDLRIAKPKLYEAYKTFCITKEIAPSNNQLFGKALRAVIKVAGMVQIKEGRLKGQRVSKRERCYIGIDLLPESGFCGKNLDAESGEQ